MKKLIIMLMAVLFLIGGKCYADYDKDVTTLKRTDAIFNVLDKVHFDIIVLDYKLIFKENNKIDRGVLKQILYILDSGRKIVFFMPKKLNKVFYETFNDQSVGIRLSKNILYFNYETNKFNEGITFKLLKKVFGLKKNIIIFTDQYFRPRTFFGTVIYTIDMLDFNRLLPQEFDHFENLELFLSMVNTNIS